MQSKHATLTAATTATHTFTLDAAAAGLQAEVLGRDGAAEIYFTVDGTDPVVGADNTYVVPASIGATKVSVDYRASLVVKLKAATATKYSVTVG